MSANHANILSAQVLDRRFEKVFFLGAVEHSHLRAFGFEQMRRSRTAQTRSENRDILILVTQNFLPQLERGQPEQSEDSRKDPEPHNDGVFLPPNQFEVVMNRRHREDATSRQPEAENLQDDRDSLDNKDAADD